MKLSVIQGAKRISDISINISIRILALVFGILAHSTTLTATKTTTATTTTGTADWTVLVFVQANNNLSPFAYKNFNDMAAVGSNQNLNILVEWHQPDQPGVWRYKVEKGKMVLDVCLPIETDGNSAQD